MFGEEELKQKNEEIKKLKSDLLQLQKETKEIKQRIKDLSKPLSVDTWVKVSEMRTKNTTGKRVIGLYISNTINCKRKLGQWVNVARATDVPTLLTHINTLIQSLTNVRDDIEKQSQR